METNKKKKRPFNWAQNTERRIPKDINRGKHRGRKSKRAAPAEVYKTNNGRHREQKLRRDENKGG